MARTNMMARRVKPEAPELLTAEVLQRRQLSPHFVRVTLGRGELDRFTHLGYDQWFRFFIPVSDGSLARLPTAKLGTVSYLRYLAISKTERPVLRSYTVRAYRPDGADGPELDVDFVIHGSDGGGEAGPASRWAESCSAGDAVAIIDEGTMFNPPPGTRRVEMVTEESGLPAAAAVLDSLPDDTVGRALFEVPSEDDRLDLSAPPGMEISWVIREDHGATPGVLALAEAAQLSLPGEPTYAWVAGEQALASGMRRHWVGAGVPKEHIMFCGYWRMGKASA